MVRARERTELIIWSHQSGTLISYIFVSLPSSIQLCLPAGTERLIALITRVTWLTLPTEEVLREIALQLTQEGYRRCKSSLGFQIIAVPTSTMFSPMVTLFLEPTVHGTFTLTSLMAGRKGSSKKLWTTVHLTQIVYLGTTILLATVPQEKSPFTMVDSHPMTTSQFRCVTQM